MDWVMALAETSLELALAVAPWLLLGLVLAGVVRALLPISAVVRALGGEGVGAVVRAAVVGLPLPLCSCGAIPAALQLHRRGAGRGPATAFLVGTPGIGIDAVILSAVLLGPLMAVVRAGGAAVLAVTAGLAVVSRSLEGASDGSQQGCAHSGCCGDPTETPGRTEADDVPAGAPRRLAEGLHYAFSKMVDDIGGWMLVGLATAAVVMTMVPPDALAAYGTGLAAMAVVSLAGIPMYICATAATPIAAAMIAGGVSPGTALVFLLAAPVTSLASLAVLRATFGWRYLARYVGAIALGSIALGLSVDAGLAWLDLSPVIVSGGVPELVPEAVAYAALGILLVCGVRPVRRGLGRAARALRPYRPAG